MASKIEDIRAELTGKTGMNSNLEAELIERITEIENCGSIIVKPMTKADLVLGVVLAIGFGILPVILVGLELL